MGIVHKRVLNALEHNPDAPAEELAASVSGATAELVDRIRDEFSAELQTKSQQDESDLSSLNPMAGQNGASTDETDESETDESESNEASPTEDGSTMSGGSFDGHSKSDRQDRPTNTESSTDSESPMRSDDPSDPSFEPEEPFQSGSHEQPDTFSPSTPIPDNHGLSNKQLRTLQAIYEYPEASQRELAEVLGVDHSTVAYRVSTIDDFTWDTRQSFVNSFFENEGNDERTMSEMTAPRETVGAPVEQIEQQLEPLNQHSPHLADIEANIEELDAALHTFNQRIADLTEQLQTVQNTSKQESQTIDSSLCPEVAHHIIQACMDHDSISEEEEREIIQSLLDL